MLAFFHLIAVIAILPLASALSARGFLSDLLGKIIPSASLPSVGTVVPAVTSSASTTSTVQCLTNYGLTSKARISTTTSTTTRQGLPVIATSTSTPIRKVTPAPVTSTSTTTTTRTSTFTASTVTDTFSTTSTINTVFITTVTNTVTENTSTVISSTTTVTSTVPTNSGFLPVGQTTAQSQNKRSEIVRSNSHRGRGLLPSTGLIPSLGLTLLGSSANIIGSGTFSPGSPQSVTCTNTVIVKTVIIFVQTAATSTTTIAPVTSTVFNTATATTTTTVLPKDVSTTLSFSTTVTQTTTATALTTTTVTSTQTLVFTSTTSAYAACGTANFLGPLAPDGTIIATGAGGSHTVQFATDFTSTSAQDCCNLCQTTQFCGGSFYSPPGFASTTPCLLMIEDSCPVQYPNAGAYYTSSDDYGYRYIVSNGNCGQLYEVNLG